MSLPSSWTRRPGPSEEGIEAAGVVTDVTDYSSVESLAKETVSRFGAVHVVCNNAGTGGVSEGYMWEHDLADWRWGIDVLQVLLTTVEN